MDGSAYIGLFHLSSGALAFVTMLAGLREWGLRREHQAHPGTTDEEIAWHGVDTLKILDIIEETHDIKTFRLQRQSGELFPEFFEGQFITFQIPHGDGHAQRSYSISSSSGNRQIVSVSIKKIADGVGSGWFHERSIGDEVTAYTPNGLFTTEAEKYKETPLVLVAGGIGITPFVSMLQSAVDVGSTTPMHLFYGMKTSKDMAFHAELEALAKRYRHIHYHPVLSDGDESWSGKKGYINYDLIRDSIGECSDHKFYFCGPPVMTDSIREQLIINGTPEENIHGEKFASPVSLDLDSIPEVTATIEFNGTEHSYKGKETLLDFLEEKGESINFACRVGVCGACKCKVTSGEADAFSDSGLTADEKKEGYVLTCVSRPKGNLTIKD